jgi:dienelactone hydrolase
MENSLAMCTSTPASVEKWNKLPDAQVLVETSAPAQARRQGLALLLPALLLLQVAPARAVDYVEPSSAQIDRCMAQESASLQQMCLGGYTVKGLTFPQTAEEFGMFSRAGRMAIFKPRGEGPFPAVLLLHTCAAVDFDAQHMRYWVQAALEAGYVAFVVDSWSQRGIAELCRTRPPGFLQVHMMVRARDAYEALAHLSAFRFVDAARVGALGFSNGGRVSYLLASAPIAAMYAVRGLRFGASVAVYGQCFNREFGVNFLRPDVDQPLLALLGGRDEDGNPEDCLPRLQDLKERGVAAAWHVYPQAGHAWDQSTFRTPQRYAQIGNSAGVLFAYDAKIADDSRERVFTFLAQQLKPK